jgi:hypothetical protein
MGANVQNYYWLQKYHAGKDPIKYLEESDSFSYRKFFVVRPDSIYYGADKDHIAIVQGKINL